LPPLEIKLLQVEGGAIVRLEVYRKLQRELGELLELEKMA